ncbi:MAG: hypothetical protein JOZ99_12765 [Actinobacteria bacterium]|nr:hypothetical protein [Actinomycetota bacterium]
MRRSRVHQSIDGALVPLLEPGEQVRARAAAWMADRRPRVPLLLTGRALYFLAITDRRLLVFDTPRRGRPLLEADLLMTKRLDAITLRGASRRPPLLQVRLGMGKSREVVLEFRPRDRDAGRAFVDAFAGRAGSAAESTSESTSESTGESTTRAAAGPS